MIRPFSIIPAPTSHSPFHGRPYDACLRRRGRFLPDPWGVGAHRSRTHSTTNCNEAGPFPVERPHLARLSKKEVCLALVPQKDSITIILLHFLNSETFLKTSASTRNKLRAQSRECHLWLNSMLLALDEVFDFVIVKLNPNHHLVVLHDRTSQCTRCERRLIVPHRRHIHATCVTSASTTILTHVTSVFVKQNSDDDRRIASGPNRLEVRTSR